MTEFTSCEDCVHNNSGNDCYCNKCIYSELQDNFKPKQKKVELEGGMYTFNSLGKIERASNYRTYVDAGLERDTITQAELASKRMTQMNRLSALAAQLGGEKEFVEGHNNWAVMYINDRRVWEKYANSIAESPCNVYMTQRCAEQICDLLNKGLFSLDGE